jgi:glycosyltransferase involved in cell wall biosynthesis
MTNKVTLIIFTLNELEGMKAIMPRIKKEWVDEILVSDGGSTDGTIEWAEQNGYNVYVQKREGIRHAYSEALPLIGGNVIITFSPDGNSIPELIPELVKKMNEGNDMVIASRYMGPAKSDDDGIITGLGNWFFTKSVNVLHGGSYTDAMVIYRAYRKQVFYDLELDMDDGYKIPEKIFFTNMGLEPLLSVRALKRKLKITEIPGDEPARIGGESKLQKFRWGAAYYFQFIWELFFWK